MSKQKIRIEFEDEKGEKKSIEREIDITKMQHVEELENDAWRIGHEGMRFIMEEGLKKKKMNWFRRLWWRIKHMYGMGKKKWSSREKSGLDIKDKNY